VDITENAFIVDIEKSLSSMISPGFIIEFFDVRVAEVYL